MNNKKDGNSVNFWLPMVQNRSHLETLTPHKIATVFLVREYLELKQTAGENEFTASHKKKFYLLLLKLIQYSDMNYRDLYGLLRSDDFRLYPLHLERFEKIMQMISSTDNGIEALFDLQADVDRLMSDTPDKNGGVCQFGIVGLYLRRVHVTLDKMTFSQLLNLYKSIKEYYEKGSRIIAIAPTNFGELKADKDRASCKWSTKQAELFVSQQSNLLLNDETEAMEPKALQSKLCEIIQDNQRFSQAYFLCYMNSIRLRDYFNAVDALKRTFDMNTWKSESKGYQFSSLNLAILHAQFGHRNEALQSLKECIMLSQEAGDRVCLDLAKSWLCYIHAGEKSQQIDSSASSKPDLSVAMNSSVAIQTLVQKSALNGSTPAKLFEMLLKSDALNCQHSLMNLMSTALAERTALWCLYGKNELGAACSQVLLSANLKKLGKMYNSDGICEAICSNALWLGLQGEYTQSAAILQHAKTRFPRYPMSQYWITVDAYLTSVQAAISGQWHEAEDAVRKLHRIDEHLTTIQRISINVFKRNLKRAQAQLYKFLDQKLESNTRVRALILLANTMITADDINPEAINVLNRAMTIARVKFLSYEVSLIQAHFANIFLHYKMPQRALKCIKTATENILANGSLYDKAKIQFLTVRCIVACCNSSEKRRQKLVECQFLIQDAEQAFLKLEAYCKVQDLYAYLAEECHECGNFEARNQFSYKFKKSFEQFPVDEEYFNVFY